MIITPSILTTSAEDAFAQIQHLTPYFNYFQIDIADGIFVENKTVSMEEIATYIHRNASSALFREIYVDFHLMVQNFEADIKVLRSLQGILAIKNVLVHIKLKPDYALLKSKNNSFVIGLVFNPEDDVQFYSTEYPYSEVDVVQVMSVVPGKQGNPFIPDSLHKLEQLRTNGYRNKIFLDGGINAETLPVILTQQNPPDGIGPGSYLSQAENIEQRVEEIKQLCLTAGISPVLKVT